MRRQATGMGPRGPGVGSVIGVGSSGQSDAWQLITADLEEPDVGTLWDLCLHSEYDRDQLVGAIADWIGPPDGMKVLDAACGSGFPALSLHRLGYDVTCTDGSSFMLERFRSNAAAAEVPIEPREALWEELAGMYPDSFDVVLCRGCSFIYAGTFETDAEPDRTALESSLQGMVGALRSGGRLYVDTTQEEDLDGEDWHSHPPRTIDGHTVEIDERVIADPENRLRRWNVQLRIDDTAYDFERHSHYVPHDEFAALLEDAGLVDVGKADVEGERYAVFEGRKP
jgi:SAM-dependent methyltransferase